MTGAGSDRGGATPGRCDDVRRTVLSDRLTDYVMQSPSLGTTSSVRVLEPQGAPGDGPFPVMFLLHGSDDDHRAWTVDGKAEVLTEHQPIIVVMPDCGRGGWYSNWCCSDGPAGAQQWETYHLTELLPWVEQHLPVRRDRGGRSIVGLSMGGFGAMSYAARHPDLFGFAAAFSGAVDILDPHLGIFADAMADMNGGRAGDIWGDRSTSLMRWRGHNPVDLAGNLAHVELQLRTGNGQAGGRHGGGPDLIETTVHQTSVTLHRTLERLGKDHVWDDYGPGAHQFPYWSDDLAATLPAVLEAAARPTPTADDLARTVTLHHLSHDPATEVWGWRLDLDHTGGEPVQMELAETGLRLQGDGSGSVATPCWFGPGELVGVRDRRRGTTVDVRVDGTGSMRLPVSLDPAGGGVVELSWSEQALATSASVSA